MTAPSTISEPAASVEPSLTARIPWLPLAFVALTAAICVSWSAAKLLWWDEFLEFWTDHQPGWAQVAHIQLHWPVSLDPLVYHCLASTAMRLLGPSAFAIRLPALLGFLVLQFCLYLFVRRLVSERAAIFALVVPALTATLYYAVEARPYGLLLGLCGIAMVSWQAAVHRETHRAGPLLALALSLALAINTHYYGALLLIPFLSAELFRAIRNRRIDLPVLAAIAAGAAALVFVVPFARAAAPFRHYDYFMAQNRMTPAVIATAYTEFFLGKNFAVAHGQLSLLLIAALLLFLVLAFRRRLRATALPPEPEVVFLVVLAGLPVFGFLLAVTVTHVFEPRHMIVSIAGIAALAAISLDSLFRRDRIGRLLIVFLFAELACGGIMHVRIERNLTRDVQSPMLLTPQVKAAVLASPSGRIYIQQPAAFSKAWYYEPDPEIRSRIVFVYSREEELRWSHMDVISLTELHLRHFTSIPIESWDSVTTQPGNQIFVTFKDSDWDWFDKALAADHADVQPLGPAFQGQVVSVRFRDPEMHR
ncbi:MAG: glycosyltransferase family 39 protein [Acidobacteriaceae bacterium]